MDRPRRWVDRITSDAARPIVAVLCVVWIGFMAAQYTRLAEERKGWINACLAEPSACAGRRVFLSVVEVVALNDDGYTVRKVVHDIPIKGDPSRVELGMTLSVVARFDPEVGALVEVEPMEHPRRALKRGLAVAGLVLAAGFGVNGLRATRRGLALRG
ncbi:MAG: hypothetical protein H6739_00425 [Alphaproteobacteria bacterium]|nr:hypothetical protein [Alphaproteobacteria bacterium]